MFVQSARTVEEHGESPTERLTFRGVEKNDTTIRLAKMNLAVHGLEGDIRQAIIYYDDPHELLGRADYVMANPPFNVDEIDADRVRTDPRLPFGLPGVNKKQKVGNGSNFKATERVRWCRKCTRTRPITLRRFGEAPLHRLAAAERRRESTNRADGTARTRARPE